MCAMCRAQPRVCWHFFSLPSGLLPFYFFIVENPRTSQFNSVSYLSKHSRACGRSVCAVACRNMGLADMARTTWSFLFHQWRMWMLPASATESTPTKPKRKSEHTRHTGASTQITQKWNIRHKFFFWTNKILTNSHKTVCGLRVQVYTCTVCSIRAYPLNK